MYVHCGNTLSTLSMCVHVHTYLQWFGGQWPVQIDVLSMSLYVYCNVNDGSVCV